MPIQRTLGKRILRYARQFPVVTITGPRQSGKTTLCRMLFPQKHYFSLEDLDLRNRARTDPRGFLEDCLPGGAVLDEVQRVPELTSYLQTVVDKTTRSNLFILTGSQNFQLLHSVSQSLAGRTALATLLPFSYAEAYSKRGAGTLEQILYRGFYPRIHDKKLNPTEALSFYVSTYLERDVRSLLQVRQLSQFETFLKLCAARTGQILNLSSLGSDCGINHNTAKSWLSVLEASYIVHLVRPHHRNYRKRLVKAPKLHFVDVGLACYLLDITHPSQLAQHPLKGALFETFVFGEILKQGLNAGRPTQLFYFRDNLGNEVDLLIEEGRRIIPIEIKLGKTVGEDALKGLRFYAKLNPASAKLGRLIYGGNQSLRWTPFEVLSYKDLAKSTF